MIQGGKSYVSSPPVVSNDAKCILVSTGNTVSIFSVSTALLINELEGHQALVTSVVVASNTNKLLNTCWTSSLDGTIRHWDFYAQELLKTVDVKLPIFSMVIPSLVSKQDDKDRKQGDLFAYISIEDITDSGKKPKPLRGQIRKCNLTACKLVSGVILKETELPEFITVSPSGEFLGIQNKRTIHIWKVPAIDSKHPLTIKMKLHHTKSFTTFAFHPDKSIVAAGDISGRILIWRGFGKRTLSSVDGKTFANLLKHDDERPGVRGDDDAESCTTWHWHSSEVKFLSFSSDGAYLYSGGHEGVLVLWQLDTGKQKFLPQIGSPLLYFVHSPDPSLSVISCADNQIHIIKMTSLEIIKSIAGIKLPCSFPDMWNGVTGGFNFDRSAGLAALPTENYRIQFYSLFHDREVSEVQICERNHQPSDDITVVVSLVAISHDGSMMSTVETRLPEDGVGGLICLKFWASEAQKKDFKLSTIVYEPHRDAAISAIAFRPGRKMVVSSSYGGDFKVWVTSTSGDNVYEYSGWVCHSVGGYKDHPMTAATFSADGSVLAVAAETVITLWDPDRNSLVGVIGETHTPILSLSFAGMSECVVSTSQGSRPQLSLWCLSKLTKSWSYDISIEAVACMENDTSFAVLALLPASEVSHAKDGVILVFDISCPVPVATWLVRKAKGGGLAFIQTSQVSYLKQKNTAGEVPSALLAYINSDHEYLIFDPLSKDQQELDVSQWKDRVDLEETGRSGYASIFGELPKFELKKTSQASILLTERPWETIFSGPSHTLPPLTKLCSDFLESLLEKRAATTV